MVYYSSNLELTRVNNYLKERNHPKVSQKERGKIKERKKSDIVCLNARSVERLKVLFTHARYVASRSAHFVEIQKKRSVWIA
jgi:hypothetical protein